MAAPGTCGPVLDEILNCAKLGDHTSVRDEGRFCTIEPRKPVGQTFAVGADIQEVYRIALWQAFWHETWQPDEVLMMTLWDSPQKHTSYGRFGIPYSRRMWEGAVPMFTLDACVQSNRSYYFELTVEVEPLRPAELPRDWLLSGERPGFAAGDGKLAGIGIAKEDYRNGYANLGGEPQSYDLWFEVHVRRPIARDAPYQGAFNLLELTYAPLKQVRKAVRRRDWETAARELVKHFETRADLVPPEHRRHDHDPDYDTRLADLAREQKVLMDDGTTTVDLAPDWNHFALWPERGGVGLTRSGLRKWLAAGYSHTGNEKYARAWNSLLTDFFTNCPSPLRAGVFKPDEPLNAALPPGLAGGSMWSGLSIGARMGHGFSYYSRLVDSPNFTQEVRAAFIINLGEMAEVLDRMRGGGNWETQMADALFDFGLTYPEFKGANERVRQGFDTLVANALRTVRPDGVLQEPSIGYHMLVMNRYSSLMERVGPLRLRVPEAMMKLTERMFEFVMYSALPDGTLPVWGDANHPMSPDYLDRGAKLFRRDDFLFVWSKGNKGTLPPSTSVGFPNGGYYYMRSGWQREAHYLGIHCGPYGSHGHQDTLGFVLAAFGRPVLIDPGVSTYGTPESRELSATRSHNTVTVDNRDAASGNADAWVTSEHFDYFAGHNEGYRGLKGVHHYRRLWFLKPFEGRPAMWVVLDDVIGEGEHEAQVRYRFAPLPVRHTPAASQVWTANADSNLLLRVVPEEQTRLEVTRGIAVWDKLTEVPVATFSQQGKLPAAFTSLLVPFRGETPPPYKAEVLPVSPSSDGARAVWITMGNEAILLVANGLASLHDEQRPVQVTLPDDGQLTMAAVGAVVWFARKEGQWLPSHLGAIRVRSVALNGKALFVSDKVNESLDTSLR